MKIYVGAGTDAPTWSKNGWTCNDLPEAAKIHGGITLVGPCWQLGVDDASVDEVLAKGMLEHLTYHEVARSLVEWRRVLKPGGFITCDVPDIDQYLRVYLVKRAAPETMAGEGGGTAEGEPDDHEACSGLDRWLRRALYGWQRYPGDEHRSGWTNTLLKHYLTKYFGGYRFEIRHMALSFDQDLPGEHMRNIFARAWKE